MRYALLSLLVPTLLATGCSLILSDIGPEYSEFDTREKAHKLFGKPTSAGSEDGQAFEEFYTRRKFKDGGGMEDLARFYCTLGLNELYLFPVALFRLTRTTILGQTLRLTYDEEGSVEMYDLKLRTPEARKTGNE